MSKYIYSNPILMSINDFLYDDPFQKKSSDNIGNILKYNVISNILNNKEKLSLSKQAYFKGFSNVIKNTIGNNSKVADLLTKIAFFIELGYEENIEKSADINSYSILSKESWLNNWFNNNSEIRSILCNKVLL